MSDKDAEGTQATETLDADDQSYRALFDNANAGIGRSRLSDGKLVIANRTLAEMFGYPSVDEFIAEFSFAEHYEDPAQRLQAISKLKHDPDLKYELSLHKPDGSPITVQSAGRLHDDGEHLDFVIVDITERKKAEDALRKSESRFRALATVSPVGIFHADTEGKVTYLNEKWCEIGDMSLEEGLGDGWKNALHPDERELISAGWDAYAREGSVYQYEQRYQRKDGSTTHCFVQAIGEFDESGEQRGYVGTVTDITRQKKAEAALVESETRYRNAASMAKMGHWVWDEIENKCAFCSEGTAQIHGMNVAEYLEFTNSSERNDSWAHPDDRERFTRTMRDIAEQGQPYDIEYKIVARGGQVRHIREIGEPEFDQQGVLVRTTGMVQDITEIKEAELALVEGEKRHQKAAALAKMGYWVWDEIEDTCIYCSEETAKMHAVSVEEFVEFTNSNERDSEWVHPDDRDHYYRTMIETKERAESFDLEYRIVARDGVVRHVREIGEPEFDSNGVMIRSNGMIQDISDLKEAETAARQAMIDAQDANRAKSNFLSTMSHEIRTPLNGVLGLAQLLTNTDLDKDQRKKVETILSSGHSLLAILNDVLDMSRIEAGGLDLENTAFNLRDLIATIATPFQSLADDKGIKLITINQFDSDGIIKGDPVRLRQIIWNLLSNAIKFTATGEVNLTVTVVSETSTRVLVARDHVIRVSVTDTGSGISPDRLSAIFDAFSQEDSSITRKFGGTGLGLSIVRQLTEMIGGTIEVESEVGQGTRFDVYLPFDKASDTEVENMILRRLHEEIETVSSLKVLVAEDNDVNAMIARAFLEKFGHHVRLAENGRIAVEIARENWADLILMDVHMPEMDGIEATRIIRSTDSGSMLPIIGLTAEAFAERHAQFIEAGMDNVLTKPFTEQQLAMVLVPYGQSMDPIRSKQEVANGTVVVEETSDESGGQGSPSEPVGDDDALLAFSEKIDAETLSNLLGKAQLTLEKRMSDIRLGLDTSNSDLIYEAAHSIKGSSGSLFARRISALAEVVETKSSELEDLRSMMPVMEQTAQETISWWRSKMT